MRGSLKFGLGGLGKLTDGVLGGDDHASLTWTNSSVTIDFHFDTYRHFKAIHIYSTTHQYRALEIRFDGHQSISHTASFIATTTPTVFMDTVDLGEDGHTFIGRHIEMNIESDSELLQLTEIKFDNEPTTIADMHTATTTCETRNRSPVGS